MEKIVPNSNSWVSNGDVIFNSFYKIFDFIHTRAKPNMKIRVRPRQTTPERTLT